MGQEERRQILPAQRRRSAESQVGPLDFVYKETNIIVVSYHRNFFALWQVGFPLLWPRGCLRYDREAQAGHRQAQVSIHGRVEEGGGGTKALVECRSAMGDHMLTHSSHASSLCQM